MTGVLFVSNFLTGAGLNRVYSEELADRLEARGREIFRTSSVEGKVARLVDMLRTTWRLRDRYAVAHVDVFSGPAFVWAESVCLMLRALRKPFVLTLRGGNLPSFAERWPRRVRALLESADEVTVPSAYLADTMAPYRKDLRVVRNAIELANYPFAPRARPRPSIAWVRAFHEIYNPVMAVEVLARVARSHPEAELVMIGPDKDGSLEAVKRRATDLSVVDRLSLPGQVAKAKIPEYLAKADVFINTTDIDNTPISVIEAMATGLCVVSTSVGGIPFLLRDNQTALLVPPRDPDAMTAAVLRTLDEPKLAGRLSQNAHDFASSCDWGLVLDDWSRTFDGLAR